jgi:hypothetical protein
MRYSGGCLADRAVCLIDRAAANLGVAHPLRPPSASATPEGVAFTAAGQHHAHLQRTRLVPVPPFGFGFRARARVPMLVALQLVDVYAPVVPIAGGVKPCRSIARR